MRALSAVIPNTHTDAGLGVRISELLRLDGVRHCAWKGDPKIERFDLGHGDLDLLVDRTQAIQLAVSLAPLGFRPTVARATSTPVGMLSLFAPHPDHGALVHVHASFRLLIGRSGRVQYHLPIERTVLQTAVTRDGLRVPEPSVALLLFVLHSALRHDLRDRGRVARWMLEAERTLLRLERSIGEDAVRTALAGHLSVVPWDVWRRCRDALRSETPSAARLSASIALRSALDAHRAPWVGAAATRATDRIAGMVQPRTAAGRERPLAGGLVIALVGGDGAGKSTCALALVDWLRDTYRVEHVHLGRPPRSLLTLATGGALKVASALRRRFSWRAARVLHEHLELARVACTARDRRRARARIGRLAAAGTIVVCERHPVAPGDTHAGASDAQGVALDARSRFADRLRAFEHDCYRRLSSPDLTLVLRLHPDLAVARKPEEPADYVHARASAIWAGTWDRPGFHVVDAARPLLEVMRDLRAIVWRSL